MDLTLNEGEICRLVQDDSKGEPMVLLRRTPESATEVLTVQEAHQLAEQFGKAKVGTDDGGEFWWWELDDLLEGIR